MWVTVTLCRFRSRLAWPRIAPRERREAIQEGGGSERAADRFRAAQRRHRLGRGGRVDQVAERPMRVIGDSRGWVASDGTDWGV